MIKTLWFQFRYVSILMVFDVMFDYGVQSTLLKLQQKTMAFDGWLKITMTAEAAASAAVATYHFQHIYLIKLHEKRKSNA